MDAGETEASTSGRGRQTASTKSKSGKELPRTERTTEGANKPVSGRVHTGFWRMDGPGNQETLSMWFLGGIAGVIQKGHCAGNLEPLFALILSGKGWQMFYVWHGSSGSL